MSRPTLGLFGARRPAAATPVKLSSDDCFAGLTPIERAMAEALSRPHEAAR